jgi:hypothetical protein
MVLMDHILGLTAFTAVTPSLALALAREDGATTVAKRQPGFFEVTGCHSHGETLFCIYDGEEWEVVSGVDADSASDSFEGCHNHSDTEMSVLI